MGQQAVKTMQQQGQGTLIFTGASASIRGKPYFAAFTTGKAALRAYAQGLAKELNPQNGRGALIANFIFNQCIQFLLG